MKRKKIAVGVCIVIVGLLHVAFGILSNYMATPERFGSAFNTIVVVLDSLMFLIAYPILLAVWFRLRDQEKRMIPKPHRVNNSK